MFIETIRRKKGAVYKAYVKRHGTVKTKTFPRKLDAQRWAEKMEAVLLSQGRIHLTFGQLAAEWLENHSKLKNAPATRVTYQSQLKEILPWFGARTIHDLAYADVERLLTRLKNQVRRSNKTLNRYLGVVRTVMNYGLRKGDLLYNPVRKNHFLPEQEVGFQYWQESEAERFVAHADEKYRDENQHVPLLYRLALNTGMRWGEIIALKWDAVVLRGQPHLVVKRSYCNKSRAIRETTKGKAIRYVGINPVLLEALQQASRRRRSDSDLVVWTETGACLDQQNFMKRHFHPDLKESGVNPIRFHDLRHTFASLYMMNRGEIFDLQKILGHQNVQTTLRYAHLAKDYIIAKSNVVVIGKRDNVIQADFEARRASL